MRKDGPPILVSGAAAAAVALLPFQRPNLTWWIFRIIRPGMTDKKLLALPRMTLGDVALGVAFLLFAVWVVRSREWRRLASVPAGVAAYLAVVLVSGLASGHAGAAAKEFVQSVELFAAAYLVFASALTAPAARRSTSLVLLEVTALIVLVALVQYLAGEPDHLVRAGFEGNNALGVYLALVLPLALGAGLALKNPRAQSVLFATSVAGLLVIRSGCFLAAAAAGMVLTAGLWSRKALAATLGAVLVVTLVVIPTMRGGAKGLFRSARVFGAAAGRRTVVTARYKRWGAAVKLIEKSPVLGEGPGRFTNALEGYYGPGVAGKPSGDTRDVEFWNVQSDEPGTFSMYVVTACETGLLGLAALLWVFAAAAGSGARALGRVQGLDRGLICGALGAMAGVLVAGVFGSPLVRGIWPVMVFVMALAGSMADEPEAAASCGAPPAGEGGAGGRRLDVKLG